ncbi:MACPF domain-containing protein NSL1 [Acorus calamus]|uniref:MACPF domain-containing protein NSL1 n=1 Tax=Acorus calamus TaxID=4465 RepID=A0AAV9DPQ8_ACOCL|nr:MACPF domain-containing protein NSL1 [Acorus calamus]
MRGALMDPLTAAREAVSAVGCGYDLCDDVRLSCCKRGPGPDARLVVLDDDEAASDLVVPGGVVVPRVPASIRCDKGERTRFRSDVLSFQQMSEHFNQEHSLSGKIPSGPFNAMFGFSGCWQKDASLTKSLAYDGWFITLYNIELRKSQLVLHDLVKQEVPSSWDPAVLAEFIGKYGTHVVVGVKMGGKEVIHLKQQQNSPLDPNEVQNLLKKLADERFSENFNDDFILDADGFSRKAKEKQLSVLEHHAAFAKSIRLSIVSHSKKDEIISVHVRRGGIDNGQSHSQWLLTIPQSPNAICMSFVPITSLLTGVRGSGFLSHAVNLYLRYKPPLEELQQFLEFQIPRQWAPTFSELPLGPQRKKHGFPSLQFTLMGPKLYVNTGQVESGNRPVTGIRLYLEGSKSDRLAIHLQHLSDLPEALHLSDDCISDTSTSVNPSLHQSRAYYEPVKWRLLSSHVCTAPVQYCESRIGDSVAAVVTRACLEVRSIGMRKVLFLRLGFSTVASARIRRSEWVGPVTLSRKSGSISALISTRFSTGQIPTPPPKPGKADLNSAVFPGGPPGQIVKFARLVDTAEIVRGPENPPGYWVVTGAKLCVEGGIISLKVKYSLLTVISGNDDAIFD